MLFFINKNKYFIKYAIKIEKEYNKYIMNENEEYLEYDSPEKKKHRILKGFMIFIIIIGILVGAFFWCFYVNDKTEVATRDDVDTQTIYYDSLSKSVDDIAETKKMKFSFEQIIANSLIKSTIDNADATLKKYITGGYFILKDDSTILLGIKLRFSFFLSRVQMVCRYEKFNGGNDDNSGIRLKIEEVKVGRVPGFANLFSSISGALNLDSLVESALEGLDLAVDVNLKEREIVYTYTAFRADLKRIIEDNKDEEGSTKLEIYEDFLGRFLSNNFVDSGIKDESIYVHIDCETLTERIIEEKKLVYDLEGLRKMVNTLLPKNEKLQDQKNYLQYLNYFYVHGYNHLSDKYKTYVDEYFNFEDYASNFPDGDYKKHPGVTVLYTDNTFSQEVQQQLSNSTEVINKINNHQTILDINDENISASIRQNSKIIGYASILERMEEGKLIYNFMMIDDFYCQINKDEIIFYVSISLNGLDLNLQLYTVPRLDDNDGFKIHFDVKQIFLGSNEIEIEAIDDLLKILIESTENSDVSVNDKDGQIYFTLNFNGLIGDQILLALNNKELDANVGSTTDHLLISVK